MSAPDNERRDGPRADYYDRIWALFDQAADLPPAERQALLESAGADDPGLCAEVEQLLASDGRLEGPDRSTFLTSPVLRASAEPPDGAAMSPPAGAPQRSHL